MMDKHIIAIGGGGFGRSIGECKIEKYIVKLSNVKKPKICFIPTATGDNDLYKLNFYKVFSNLDCRPSHIDLFKRTIDLNKHISNQDIIYVGGGNTKSMIGVWKEWGMDIILRNAYHSGVIMSGVSAGAICWFSKGITDSWLDDLAIIDCLDFVEGTCCPHYDEERSRIPYLSRVLKKQLINDCFAIEGNCALHIKNGKPLKSLDFGQDKKAYLVSLRENKLSHLLYNSEKL